MILFVALVGCGDEEKSEVLPSTKNLATKNEHVDVDLTKLSATMIYSEVFNILQTPVDYRGKKIKIRGTYMVFHDPAKNEYHHACIIKDATACCMQGMEFELVDKNYPPNETEVTLIGTFDTYTIQKIDNPILRDAEIVD